MLEVNVCKGEGSELGKVRIAAGGRVLAVPWQAAKAIARELIRPGIHPSARPEVFDIRQLENGQVDVLLGGKLWISGSAEDARRLGSAILQVSGLVEEEGDAERIIGEQALITRTGALPGIGLSNNPKIRAAAKVEAEHNRDLRRYVPLPNFVGRAVPCLPIVRQFSPDPAVAARQRAALMTPAEKRAEISALEKELA